MVYEYTWYQWTGFFFVYCFFGWIFESAYVSLRKRRLVNRGFLRLPLLPLYGTGAVMMLWVSLPVKDNLMLVFLAGMAAATVLEYATGWTMEKLFRVKYWDYSDQRFHIRGYVCLSSSIAWGFLTILLTEVLHRPVERWILGIPVSAEIAGITAVSIFFSIDAVQSVKAALDLARVLDSMNRIRAELEDIQVQIALLKAETRDQLADAREEVRDQLTGVRADAVMRMEVMRADAAMRAGQLRAESRERLEEHLESMAGYLEVLRGMTAEHLAGFREQTAEHVADFREQTAEHMADFREQTAEHMADFREQTAEHMADFREQTAEYMTDFREQTAEHMADFREQTEERLTELRRKTSELLETLRNKR